MGKTSTLDCWGYENGLAAPDQLQGFERTHPIRVITAQSAFISRPPSGLFRAASVRIASPIIMQFFTAQPQYIQGIALTGTKG